MDMDVGGVAESVMAVMGNVEQRVRRYGPIGLPLEQAIVWNQHWLDSP